MIMIALLKQLTTTNMELKLRERGRSVTKFIVIDFQTAVGTGLGCSGTLVLIYSWLIGR